MVAGSKADGTWIHLRGCVPDFDCDFRRLEYRSNLRGYRLSSPATTRMCVSSSAKRVSACRSKCNSTMLKPLCHARSRSQQLHPHTAITAMKPSNAVSVVLRISSLRLLFLYFSLAILASSSVGTISPALNLSFLILKYSAEYLRPSSSNCEGVSSGVTPPDIPSPIISRSPLRGLGGGAGNALTNP